jgi:hypothetical protein
VEAIRKQIVAGVRISPEGAASATASGYSWGSGNNQTLVISLDASQLTASAPYFRVNMTSSENLISAIAVLSGARDARDASSTALT